MITSVIKYPHKENTWQCNIDQKHYIYITQSDYYRSDSRGTSFRDAYTTMYECDSTYTFYKEHKATCREYMPLNECNPAKGIRKFLQLMMLQ